MNKMVLDRRQIEERWVGLRNMGDVFLAVENLVRAQGEVVCQFKVNGMALSEADEKRLAVGQLSELDILEVSSQKPETLLSDILKNWTTEIPQIIKHCDEMSFSIRHHGVQGRLNDFVTLIDSCQFLVDSLLSLDQLFDVENDIGLTGWESGKKEMANAIGDALKAFQEKDFVLLSDVLEYDLANSLQNWADILQQFLVKVTIETGSNT